MSGDRDYDSEIKDARDHRYAYDFDLAVMQDFMIRSFRPFFRKGSLLELGSYKGAFTGRLLAHFDDVTCVEASSAALAEARASLGDRVTLATGPAGVGLARQAL